MQTLIYNARLILPDLIIEQGWLLIEQERIVTLGEGKGPVSNAGTCFIDAQGDFILPGLIDLHCDAIEKAVEPRPLVHFDLPTALREADWRLAGSGITTEFHAISLDDNEFGVRSESFAFDLCEALRTETGKLIRHKMHARMELSSERASRVVSQMIEQGNVDMVSIMDHSPGQGQYRTEEAFREYVVRSSNRSYAEVDAIIVKKRSAVAAIPTRIEHITRIAREAGLSIATHDDDTVARVEQWPALGVRISEFPTTMEAAIRAHELGLTVCMGAPNVLRGQSSGGNLSAIDSVKAGVVDALCSDYYPIAMLGATFALHARQLLTLPQATRLVTLNPAKAIGVENDFGSLEPGKMADIIQVKLSQHGIPHVQRLFVGGEERVKACIR